MAVSHEPFASDVASVVLHELRELTDGHPIWSCKLLRACERGHLTRTDFRFIFSQYQLYSINFTRYLAGLMVGCESDYFRSKLVQNLWEESGAIEPSQRHAELYREFLRTGLGVDVGAVAYADGTRNFVDEYLRYCQQASPTAAAAFLALGTEAIVPRLYTIFLKGLQRVGIDEGALTFFHLHVECDDEHAVTLQELLVHYSGRPGWREQARQGLVDALDARLRFFDSLYRELQQRRVAETLRTIDARKSLCSSDPSRGEIIFAAQDRGVPLYANKVSDHNIDFEVERLPLSGDVLDTRLVKIPPGRCNELHKHAHETIFYIVRGSGTVHVNDAAFPVQAGDIAFVPRWAMHQTENHGSSDLLILAITDYNLTGRALIGNYNRTARRRQDAEHAVQKLAISSSPGPAVSGFFSASTTERAPSGTDQQ